MPMGSVEMSSSSRRHDPTMSPLLVDPEMGLQAPAAQALGSADDLMHQQEQSPAYRALHDAGLIVHTYRLRSAADLDVVTGNATIASNYSRRALAYTGGLLIGGIIYDACYNQFSVQDGTVRPAQHADGSFFFFGPGVHRVLKIFITVGEEVSLMQARIEHGNRTIVTVPQGFVGLATDRGQPILLAPGLHQWRSDTLKLSELIDLSTDVIRIGPFTLLTVDEGYAAITQDNGKQRVLGGGATHMLTHRNWKFEKLISLKIHTDDLGPFRATSADNVVLETTATVNWRVEDPTLAARMAADTMESDSFADGRNQAQVQLQQGKESRKVSGNGQNSTLRRDVLKQAVASLAAAMGSVRYADDVHISASEKVTVLDTDSSQNAPSQNASGRETCGVSQIFSIQQMASAVRHANEICSQYGVSIISINVISAIPMDKVLEEALSAGAVAAAGAQQAEIAARGNAKAKLISAQSEAEAARIKAQATADAERLHAQGKKDAASLLETSNVAVDLARMEKTGQLLDQKTTFFFGAGPAHVPALLSNPMMTRHSDKEAPMELA
mmetsp:Transcript_70402/g.150788  ORF Transcript_70402/g.150788 Transcript_70402/m.150788 type:complete len:556 (+) Transcript_70402:80-1747(+)